MASDSPVPTLQPLLDTEPVAHCPQPFDCWGRPLLPHSFLGGWKAASFLLVANSLLSLAVSGCTVNLVIFLVKLLEQDNASAANTITNWMGTTFITSLIGGSLGDAYLGRLWTSIVYQILFVAGMLLSALSGTMIAQRCVESPLCELTAPASAQVSLFYIALYMIGLGMASLTPNLVSLGADQFDSPTHKSAFITLYMASANVGMLLSTTLISYLENQGRWALGFWLSAGAAVLAFVSFLAVMPKVRQYNPGEDPLLKIARVVFAASRKLGARAQSNSKLLHEAPGRHAKRRTRHTESLRWLEKASRMETFDGHHVSNPWSLSTVNQVEEVKSVCRLVPFWLCGILISAVLTEKGTLFILQGATMDNRVGNFEFPPSSMGLFSLVTVIVGAPLYSWVLVPCFLRFRKLRKEVSSIERMGVGLVIAVATMSVAAMVETQRLNIVHRRSDVHEGDGSKQLVPMSIFWLVPQYVLEGLTTVFFACGHLDFNYSYSPEGMRSLATAISLSGLALGNYLSSFIIKVVTAITSRRGRAGWIPKNLNEGHLDYFYWLLDALLLLTFAMFLVFARWLGDGDTASFMRADQQQPEDAEDNNDRAADTVVTVAMGSNQLQDAEANDRAADTL